MSRQLPFTEYEAVLLLDAYLKTLSGDKSKMESIRDCSSRLRQMAINMGMEIDAVYRNVNGISFQMASMESAYKGYTVMKPATRLFTETVLLYRNNAKRYQQLLMEANKMAGANNNTKQSNEDKFITWLAGEVSGTQLSELYIALREIEQQAKKDKTINASLYESLDVTSVKKIKARIESCKIFRYKHKRQWGRIASALNFMMQYAKRSTTTDTNELSEKKQETQKIDLPQTSLVDVRIGQFIDWLNKNKKSAYTAERLVTALETGSEYGIKVLGLEGNLWEISDAEEFEKSYLTIADSSFGKDYSVLLFPFKTACKHFIEWLNSTNKSISADDKRDIKLYQKLYSVSKVYDDPSGLTVSKIMSLIGNEEDEQLVRTLLDDTPWATKISEDVYSFSRKTPKTEPADFDKNKFVQTLLSRYRNGMQFDSIDFENFLEMYEMLFDEKLSFTDSELEERLRYCGVMYKDRLFPAEGILDNDTKEKLFSYIENSFASGKKVLYYKAILEDLADDFASCYALSDENMLRAYIEFTAEKDKYFFFENYMSVEKHVSVNHNDEVEEYLLSVGKPIATATVCAALSHIPKDQVVRIITSDNRFLRNAKGEYFHTDIFEVSDSELDFIAGIINDLIKENGYAIWTDIWNVIQDKMPIFVENNLYLSGLGIRNALAQRLVNKFNFESAVISLPNDRYAMRDVYQLYARHHSTFSAEDIYNLSKELDTVIYFDALAEVSFRISHDTFVSKQTINFDAGAIDKAIESFISKDYIRIREIDSFLAFPNIGYEWNEFLLESFVYSYSKKFSLLNNGFSLNNVAGAIVKKNGSIHEFVDACAAVLAEGPISLNKKDALDYLAEVNMITRRSYKDLDQALRKATQIRARKG